MSGVWTEIACEVPTAMVEAVADFLVELSGNGVSVENLDLDTFDLETIGDTPVKTVKAYFPGDTVPPETIAAIDDWLVTTGSGYDGYTHKQPAVSLLNEEDWANAWKRHFKPQKIGRRLVIKPSWEEFKAADEDIVLELDPGRAFGTGAHATTRLCLIALERIFAKEPPLVISGEDTPNTVLDVGSGSGILSMAAARLGAKRVIGLDIDRDAVEVARENILLNGLDRIVTIAMTPLQELSGSFTIVLANIIAEELVRLAPLLVAATTPGGILVLSGILNEKRTLVQEGYAGFPVEILGITEEGEWCCLCYRRNS